MRQAMDGLGEVFSRVSDRTRIDHDVEVHDLHAKIGQLTVELMRLEAIYP